MIRRRWRAWRRSQIKRDRCEVCGVPLPPKRVHEVTDYFDDLDDPEKAVGMSEGSSMSATYCANDCPGGCDKEHTKKRPETRPKRREQRTKESAR